MTRRWIIATLFVALSYACASSRFGGVGSTKNKSKDDDKPRPSEQGEGVVGYLTDPGALQYSDKDGKITVSGNPGAVAAADDTALENIEACLQQIEVERLSKILQDQSDLGGPGVTVIAKGQVQADGSFSLAADAAPTGVLAVNVSGHCNTLPAAAFDHAGSSVVFQRPGNQGFATGDEMSAFPATTPTAALVDSFKCDGLPQNHLFKTDKDTRILHVTSVNSYETRTLEVFGNGEATATSTPVDSNVADGTASMPLSPSEFQAFLLDTFDRTCLLDIEDATVAKKVQQIDDAYKEACGPSCDFYKGSTADCEGPHLIADIDNVHYDQTFDTCNDFITLDQVHSQLAERAYVKKAHEAIESLMTRLLKGS